MGKIKIMSHKDGSVKVVLTAVVVNSFVTLAKFTGWMFSMSPSMLAEAIHSFTDTANQLLVYLEFGYPGKVPLENILQVVWGIILIIAPRLHFSMR